MANSDKPVVDQIRDLIFTGALQPGEHLLEIPMAERLGISRTPLRPALAALAHEGLLQLRGRRGYVVRKVTVEDMMDAFLVRANLESLAAVVVAQRGLSDTERAELRAILERGDALLAGPEGESFQSDFQAMNDDFHRAILRCSRNECLQDLAERALTLPLLSSRVVHFEDRTALLRSHDDHWTLFRAIDDGEVDRARAIMSEHILRSRDILHDRMVAARGDEAAPAEESPKKQQTSA